MLKSQEIIGLTAIHRESGKRMGSVIDLIFDVYTQLQGLLIEQGGWLRRRRFLPLSAIDSIGSDAVMVDNPEARQPMGRLPKHWFGVRTGQPPVMGRSVLLTSGSRIGEITNVYFLEEMGTLIGYELSDGWMNDLQYGRKMLKTTFPLPSGEDVWIVPSHQIELKDAR